MVEDVTVKIIDNTAEDVPDTPDVVETLFKKHYIDPDNSKPMTIGVILSHPGLENDVCVIADSQSHIFGQINIKEKGYSDLLKGELFSGYPMEVTRSSLDFGNLDGIITIKFFDAADELLDAYQSTRGFERGQIILFDVILASPYAVDNIARYDIFETSLSGSIIQVTAGNFNSLSVVGVPGIYDEVTSPGLF